MRILLIGIIILLFAFLILLNMEPINLKLFIWTVKVPVIVLILISFATGLLCAFLFNYKKINFKKIKKNDKKK